MFLFLSFFLSFFPVCTTYVPSCSFLNGSKTPEIQATMQLLSTSGKVGFVSYFCGHQISSAFYNNS